MNAQAPISRTFVIIFAHTSSKIHLSHTFRVTRGKKNNNKHVGADAFGGKRNYAARVRPEQHNTDRWMNGDDIIKFTFGWCTRHTHSRTRICHTRVGWECAVVVIVVPKRASVVRRILGRIYSKHTWHRIRETALTQNATHRKVDILTRQHRHLHMDGIAVSTSPHCHSGISQTAALEAIGRVSLVLPVLIPKKQYRIRSSWIIFGLDDGSKRSFYRVND